MIEKKEVQHFILTKRVFAGAGLVLLTSLSGYANTMTGNSNEPAIQSVLQQTKNVTGIVKDALGDPIIGVNVVVKGTTIGTVTDMNGAYSLQADANATLVISYIGYKTQEIPVKGQTAINITLSEDSEALDEVVVVGYGTQKKVNLTGSVSSVNFADQALSRPITDVSSALAGLSSGVTVRQLSGNPGEEATSIRIRGVGTLNNASPLVIIDGMEGDMNILNPNDIQNISILKDAASSAIYGSRAANGVILVTTKKGNKERVNVTYSGRVSLTSPTNLLDAVTNYADYMTLMNESATNLGGSGDFAQSTIDAWRAAGKDPNGVNENGVPNWLAYPNTDWQKEVYGNRVSQDHSISVNGGSKNVTYLLSAGYMDNQGLVERTGMQRFNMRANVEVNVTDWLTVGTRTYGVYQTKDPGNFGPRDKSSGVNQYIGQTTPGLIPRYNGQYGYPEATGEHPTANGLLFILNNTDGSNESSRFNTTAYTKITFFKGFSWDVNFNYYRRFDEINNHTVPQEKVKFSTGEVVVHKTDPADMTTRYTNKGEHSYTLENILRYETTINADHDLNALAGYQEYYFKYYDHESEKKGLIDENIYTPSSATNMTNIKGTAKDRAMRSFFGRVNYAYKSRYLLEANLRYDGSSRFADGHRGGVFPSFSAGWRMSEESFMKETTWLDNLKIRASWGQLGNNGTGDSNLGEYDYQAVYGTVPYSFNGTQVTGLRPKKISNIFLSWETTNVTNVGIDGSFLNNRLTAELDAYHKLTDGILTTAPIYLTVGDKDAPTANIAKVANKGFEVTIGWKDHIGKVNYSISGNFAYNNNKVTKYKGKLEKSWITDENGNKVFKNNLGEVSKGGNTLVLEDHPMNEYYIQNTYSGDGSYYNKDGTVNPNGGPKDGMIRSEQDMKWIEDMTAAGNKFMPLETIGKQQIWYGDFIYRDSNGDGIYGGSDDKEFTGTSGQPKVNFGLQLGASWNNFDISMSFAGSAGFDLLWNEEGYNSTATRKGCQISGLAAKDHYFRDENNPSASNLNGKYPRLTFGQAGQNIAASNFYLYDGSYLKMKNLTVGYTVPQNFSRKIYMDNLRVYVSTENLFTITSFPGQDPEIGASSGYPPLRQVAFGLNVTF